jgi:hypothetical protein
MLFPLSALSFAVVVLQSLAVVRAQVDVDFFNPILGGGSMLNNVGNGLGEPLNVSTIKTYEVCQCYADQVH